MSAGDFAALQAAAEAAGGLAVSAFALAPDEPSPETLPGARVVALLSAGPGMWAAFRASGEAADGAPDPLDRWSARICAGLAARFGGVAAGPNDGPPWPPFLAWAQRAEPVWPSRVGPLVHARRGLWASWRGALGLASLAGVPPRAAGVSPCLGCPAPCLSACPAGAFRETPAGPLYDVAGCGAHVSGPSGEACRGGGCLARHACPAGIEGVPGPEQARFHMAAFLNSHGFVIE
ncbi:MAG: ferredoxin [Pseudomonadota bacterium]|nr:ferredoxin [Pseudomonadota bacterium]MEE3099476.1 ferredoxin [Pseudomonadota bacterium]